jgi:hypothetical protein
MGQLVRLLSDATDHNNQIARRVNETDSRNKPSTLINFCLSVIARYKRYIYLFYAII